MARKKSVWRESDSIEPKPEPELEVVETVEPEVEVATPPAEEDAPVKPRDLPNIPLKVFVKLAGPKWDQMAGFLHYAKLKNMGPRTLPQWRANYQAFLQMPVK